MTSSAIEAMGKLHPAGQVAVGIATAVMFLGLAWMVVTLIKESNK